MNAPATLDEWADRYGQLHPEGACSAAAWLSTTLLVASLFGMLWSLPVPAPLQAQQAAINWATMLLISAFVYYCMLSIRIALAGLVYLVPAATPAFWLELNGLPVWPLALGAFIPSFVWQLETTRRATGQVRVLRNLQYLMLGPVWLLRAAFRRAGLAY